MASPFAAVPPVTGIPRARIGSGPAAVIGEMQSPCQSSRTWPEVSGNQSVETAPRSTIARLEPLLEADRKETRQTCCATVHAGCWLRVPGSPALRCCSTARSPPRPQRESPGLTEAILAPRAWLMPFSNPPRAPIRSIWSGHRPAADLMLGKTQLAAATASCRAPAQHDILLPNEGHIPIGRCHRMRDAALA